MRCIVLCYIELCYEMAMVVVVVVFVILVPTRTLQGTCICPLEYNNYW